MIRKVNSLGSEGLEQFKVLYTKYFLEEAKRTQLGFPLLYELITKKKSKAIADTIVEEIFADKYLGYVYLDNDTVVGFIVGRDDGRDPARITEAYTSCAEEDRRMALELYRRIAIVFKMRGRSKISIESSLYNEMLTYLAEINAFDPVCEYPDGYVEYEKQI